jgi:hypothetical protein
MKRIDSSVARQVACSAGFTVAEFVAAAAILFTVLMGVLGAVEYAGAATRMASMREGAIDIANDQIETDRNIPYSSLGIVYSDGSVSMQGAKVPAEATVTNERGTYTVKTEIWWPSATESTYKNVRVTVSWTQPTGGSVTLETSVFSQTTVGNVGDVQLHAVDVDNPTVAVPGITLILRPNSGSDMRATSDADGVVFFGRTPIGRATFLDPGTANTLWLVDVSGLGSPTISAGSQNLGYVYCQRPCTAAIHVRSETLPSVSGATVTITDSARGLTYTAVSDAGGWATFSAAANTVGGLAGLWKGDYTATATNDEGGTASGSFSLTTGGENFTGLELTIREPPSITISKKVAASGDPLNGVHWTVRVKDPSGTVLDTRESDADSETFQITAAGNYMVDVTGVDGFCDTTGFVFAANATDHNQACVVPMQPAFQVMVRYGGSGLPGARVTVTNTSTHVSIPSVSGANPGVTGSDGTVKFPILADGTYSVSAVYNGITYTGSDVTLSAGTPAALYHIDISLGTISVAVVPGGWSWSREVAVYDSSDHEVARGVVTRWDSTLLFTEPPGMYTVVVCGSRISPPSSGIRPDDVRRQYTNYTMTPPGLTNGGTYYFTDLYAPS